MDEQAVGREVFTAADASSPLPTMLEPREVPLGGARAMFVRRTLPHKHIRTIGAWCFVDHYGPDPVRMHVPPHPHTGLQTVTWLLEGEVEHRDSLGSLQRIVPGQVNVMTAGRAITHSEYAVGPPVAMHGVQLWVALTDQYRHREPQFEHCPDLPVVTQGDSTATVFAGSFGGVTSPATVFSPLAGAQLRLQGQSTWPLVPEFEYAVLALDCDVEVQGASVPHGALQYLGWGHDAVTLSSHRSGRVLLLGGEPMSDHLLMWWNFVGRTHEEIVEMRTSYEALAAPFGPVVGDDNDMLPAPPMPTTPLKARPPRA